MTRSRFLFALLLTTGCTEVTIIGNPPGSDPPGGEDPSSCVDAVDPDAVLDFREVTSATLFADVLHVEGQLDGLPSYAVVRLGDGVGELVALRDDLAGGASWVHVEGATYARVRSGSLDVLQADDASEAALVGSRALDGIVPDGFARSFGVADGSFYLCLSPTGGDESEVFAIDLAQPRAPGVPQARSGLSCDDSDSSPYTRGAADGSLWVNFGTEDPSWGTDNVALYDLASGGAGVVSHGFNVSGIHQYGYIRELETDGHVAVATLENDDYVFLYYRDAPGSSPPGSTVYTSFGGAEKKLLTVVDGVAYLVRRGDEADEIVGYDVRDPASIGASVAATPMQVALDGATGELDGYRALARDGERLVVTDAAGTMFVVPLGSTQPVEPLLIVQQGEAPVCP